MSKMEHEPFLNSKYRILVKASGATVEKNFKALGEGCGEKIEKKQTGGGLRLFGT